MIFTRNGCMPSYLSSSFKEGKLPSLGKSFWVGESLQGRNGCVLILNFAQWCPNQSARVLERVCSTERKGEKWEGKTREESQKGDGKLCRPNKDSPLISQIFSKLYKIKKCSICMIFLETGEASDFHMHIDMWQHSDRT